MLKFLAILLVIVMLITTIAAVDMFGWEFLLVALCWGLVRLFI
jgi:hypothetical protein